MNRAKEIERSLYAFAYAKKMGLATIGILLAIGSWTGVFPYGPGEGIQWLLSETFAPENAYLLLDEPRESSDSFTLMPEQILAACGRGFIWIIILCTFAEWLYVRETNAIRNASSSAPVK